MKLASYLLSDLFKLIHFINSSLRIKLLLIFIAVAVIPLSLVGSVSYVKSFTTIWNNTAVSTIQIAEQLNRNIEDLFSESEKLLEIGDSLPSNIFLENPKDTETEAVEILNLFKVYKSTYKFNQSIRDIYILGMNGKCINDREGVYILKNGIESLSDVKELIEEPNKVHILNMHMPEYASKGMNKMVISVGRAILDQSGSKVLGVMIVNLDPIIFENFCNDMRIGKLGYFFIVDKTGEAICWPKTGGEYLIGRQHYLDVIAKGQNGSFVEDVGGQKMFFVFNTSGRTNWKIIGKVPLADLMKDAYEIRNLTAVIVAFCIVFAIILNLYISDRLTLPLRNMKEKMKLAESGDLDVRVESKNSDEVADLGYSFNRMLEKIKILMDNSVKEQENLKKAELKLMQAQINPHFLYNTMDTIMWMATSNLNEQVVEMVEALSGFFRLSLSKGKEWISIRDEIEHVRNYLIIQQKRYMDILEYHIEIDEAILDYKILKLSLQPLVENSLYHGIKKKREGGLIRIKGGMADEGKGIVFDIFDNGVGIPKESLEEIKRELEDESTDIDRKDRGFGLYNVQKRIKLYYGKEYGLSINSKHEEWTEIFLSIGAVR